MNPFLIVLILQMQAIAKDVARQAKVSPRYHHAQNLKEPTEADIRRAVEDGKYDLDNDVREYLETERDPDK